MRKKLSIIISFILCFVFILGIKGNANSAPSSWYGRDSLGIFTMDEDCPLEVTHEDLSFYIKNLVYPIRNIEDVQSTVSAKYTFYNPKDYDVSATLVFPFGRIPDYLDDLPEQDGTYHPIDDISKYDITLDGNSALKKLRYTYWNHHDFDVNKALPLLKNDFIEDSFYKAELMVHKVSVQISEISTRESRCLAYTPSSSQYKVCCSGGYNITGQKKTYTVWVMDQDIIDFYFLGELDPDFKLSLKLYENAGLRKEISGKIEQVGSTTTKTLEDYIYKYYKEESGISKMDWFNACIDMLNENDGFHIENQFDISNNLLRWYEYDLTIKSKSTVINEVVAPLYPDIHMRYEPDLFTFTYFLTPASKWAKFSNLNIRIYTDYYIMDSQLGEFKKTDYGYELFFEQLPQKDLIFSASSSQNPKVPADPFTIIGIIIMILILVGPISVVLLVVLLLSMKNKNVSKRIKHIKLCYGIEVLLSSLMVISGICGIFMHPVFPILCVVLSVILVILFLLERCVLKNSNIGRLVVALFMMLFMCFSFVDSTISEGYEGVSVVGLIFGFILSVATIVRLAALTSKLSKANNNDIINISLPEPKNAYYPIGYISKKWSIILWVGLIVWLVSFLLTFIFTFEKLGLMSILVVLGFFLCILIFAFVFGVCMTLSNEKEFRIFFKDLDYQKMEQGILKKLEDPKINPETINYFKMKLSIYAAVYSLERHYELEKEIFIPENKGYRLQYDMKKVTFLLPEAEMNLAIENLLKQYPNKASIQKSCSRFKNLWSAYYQGNIIGSIDNVAPYQTKNEFTNGMHLYVQIAYYKHQNNLQKSQELEALFRKKYWMMKTLIDDLDGIDIRKKEEIIEARYCPNCGKKVSIDDAFCSSCGYKLKKEEDSNEASA